MPTEGWSRFDAGLSGGGAGVGHCVLEQKRGKLMTKRQEVGRRGAAAHQLFHLQFWDDTLIKVENRS
jgi:hypothetical protein